MDRIAKFCLEWKLRKSLGHSPQLFGQLCNGFFHLWQFQPFFSQRFFQAHSLHRRLYFLGTSWGYACPPSSASTLPIFHVKPEYSKLRKKRKVCRLCLEDMKTSSVFSPLHSSSSPAACEIFCLQKKKVLFTSLLAFAFALCEVRIGRLEFGRRKKAATIHLCFMNITISTFRLINEFVNWSMKWNFAFQSIAWLLFKHSTSATSEHTRHVKHTRRATLEKRL